MSQKSELYNALKAIGAPLTTSYARYTVDELEAELAQAGATVTTVTTVTEDPMPPFRLWSFLTRLLPRR